MSKRLRRGLLVIIKLLFEMRGKMRKMYLVSMFMVVVLRQGRRRYSYWVLRRKRFGHIPNLACHGSREEDLRYQTRQYFVRDEFLLVWIKEQGSWTLLTKSVIAEDTKQPMPPIINKKSRGPIFSWCYHFDQSNSEPRANLDSTDVKINIDGYEIGYLQTRNDRVGGIKGIESDDE